MEKEGDEETGGEIRSEGNLELSGFHAFHSNESEPEDTSYDVSEKESKPSDLRSGDESHKDSDPKVSGAEPNPV